MSEYKPNSHRFKEEQKELEKKKVEKVISGTAKTRKKSELGKLASVFISEDITDVKSYILMDVLVPAVKKAISDTVNMILFGSAGRSDNKRSTASRVSYREYYDKKDDRGSSSSTRTRTGYDYDDIVIDSRGEAEEVITRMDELIETYGYVSVADLYDLVGKDCQYTDNKYGWKNIRNAEPIRVRDGYLLKLPKVLPLD